jgi:hypothetical protein
MISAPPTLFVAWQNPESRLIRVVGRLQKYRDDGETGYEFVYVNEAREARENGSFRPFVTFPELDITYRSRTLFPFFTNRVIPATRQDYPEYVRELGLNSEDASPETLLARSGGTRATDHIELFAPPQHNPVTGMHEMYVLLRGLRHMPECTEAHVRALSPGQRLVCMRDTQNIHNPNAIALRTDDPPHMIGYLPDYLVEDLGRSDELAAEVVRMNPPPAPRQHRLLCRVQARWPADRTPFSDARFQPIGADPQEPATLEMG